MNAINEITKTLRKDFPELKFAVRKLKPRFVFDNENDRMLYVYSPKQFEGKRYTWRFTILANENLELKYDHIKWSLETDKDIKVMKRYDVYFYLKYDDKIQNRDIIIHAENDLDCALKVIKERQSNENAIKVDTKEKRNVILMNFNF